MVVGCDYFIEGDEIELKLFDYETGKRLFTKKIDVEDVEKLKLEVVGARHR